MSLWRYAVGGTGRGGLGRGLGALIPTGTPGVSEIPVTRIRPNPRQPRHRLEEGELAVLAESIREHGVLQPVIVTRAEDGEGYILVAGERRWSAAVQAGLERIPAVIKDVTPQGMLELALVENVQRADLNPLEEAAAYRTLIEEFGLTQEEVARRVGRDRSTVANMIRLLALPDAVQEALSRGEISEGHARALLAGGGPTEIVALLHEVVSRRLSVRETEALVRRRRQTVDHPRGEPRTHDPETARIEELFREALGTRVDVVRQGKGGRLIIHFYSEEQLQGLYDLLAASAGDRRFT
ncbi:MAG: ParB/RepB/Spo0J family partition protein [Chloroflexi bacterium]|nr:ParB/RepB/Spo0J family partition protein [Chloroflexota bacterium]